MTEKEAFQSVLSDYSKYVAHMRQQYELNPKRFGLVLGAGASKGLGFPDWKELIIRIADSDEMKETKFEFDTTSNVSNETNASGVDVNKQKQALNFDAIPTAQKLYQAYKTQVVERNAKDQDYSYNRIEMVARAGWQKIVHSALYKGISSNIEEFVPKNHYLWSYLKIVKHIPMVINYNFDDTIQRMLIMSRTDEEQEETIGYTTIWSGNVYMYPKNTVIYHPNGFLPHRLSDHPSEQFVFMEDSFADQLIDSINGHYNVLENYFSQNTCLLIGLSLNDPTLKHILRNNALSFPGIYHYYIQYTRDKNTIKNREASVDANFEVYNLITLYLNDDEINALGKLITMGDEDFTSLIDELGLQPSSYKYMLVGPVAVGKSTALSHFRNISTLDEWLEPMPSDMARDPGMVDNEKIVSIDDWIAKQWYKKNKRLLNAKTGIHLVDRGPLDAFAFTPENDWIKKAKLTRAAISPGKSNYKLCPVQVFILTGDPNTMAARAILTQRHTDAAKLEEQQRILKYIYMQGSENAIILDTRNKTKSQVAKEIARVIFLKTYEPTDLDAILKKVEDGVVKFPKLQQS